MLSVRSWQRRKTLRVTSSNCRNRLQSSNYE
jgi:hypothetical protein